MGGLIRLTIITVARSYSFVLIAILSCIFTICISLAEIQGGSLIDLFRIRMAYSLNVCTTFIFVSSIWTGCFTIAGDIESCNIHMLLVKPISRLWIWLSRFLGVFIIHTIIMTFILLIIFLILEVDKSLLSHDQKDLLNEIFIGNKTYSAQQEGLNEEYAREFYSRIKNTVLSDDEKIELMKNAMYSTITRRGEVKPSSCKIFVFNVKKAGYSSNINIKFTPYIGSPDILEKQNRPKIEGIWSVQVNTDTSIMLSQKPEIFLSNNEYEKHISLTNLSEGVNIIKLTYHNLDKNRSVFFRITESPQIRIMAANFFENYLRFLLVTILGIALMSAIGCTLGVMFSFPIAVFILIAYLVLGSTGNFIMSGNEGFLSNNDTQLKIGYSLSKTFLKIMPPIQKFQPSECVSSGILIENDNILNIIQKYFVVQFLAISIIGVYIFYKREFGMVARQ